MILTLTLWTKRVASCPFAAVAPLWPVPPALSGYTGPLTLTIVPQDSRPGMRG